MIAVMTMKTIILNHYDNENNHYDIDYNDSFPACAHPNLDLCPVESNPKLGNATRWKLKMMPNDDDGIHQKYGIDLIMMVEFTRNVDTLETFSDCIPFCGDSCQQLTHRLQKTL